MNKPVSYSKNASMALLEEMRKMIKPHTKSTAYKRAKAQLASKAAAAKKRKNAAKLKQG